MNGDLTVVGKLSAGEYLGITIPSGDFLPLSGGTITGNVTINGAVSAGSLSAGAVTATGLTLTTTPLAAGSGGTGKSSLGTGVANFLETPTSNNLALAVTDETGTGSLVFNTTPTLTGAIISGATRESPFSVGNSGTSVTLSLANGTFQQVTLTGNCTFTMPTAVSGSSFTLQIFTGAGSFTGTFTGVRWQGAISPTLTTTASRVDIASFLSDGTNWYGSIAQNYTV